MSHRFSIAQSDDRCSESLECRAKNINDMEKPNALVLLVCGLPATGKTTLCTELAHESRWRDLSLRHAEVTVHHLCFDAVERRLLRESGNNNSTGSELGFDPDIWKQARTDIIRTATQILQSSCHDEHDDSAGEKPKKSFVLVVDDNFYFRSMRKPWFQLAREFGAAYVQARIVADVDVCIEKNGAREAGQRVPEYVIPQMHANFQWPGDRNGDGGRNDDSAGWERHPNVHTVSFCAYQGVDASLQAILPDTLETITPLENIANDVDGNSSSGGCAQECEKRLRKLVSHVLEHTECSKEQKSVLAKRWQGVKKGLVDDAKKWQKVAKEDADPSDCLDILEAQFLACATSDAKACDRAGYAPR